MNQQLKTHYQWLCSIPINLTAKMKLIEEAGGAGKVRDLEKDVWKGILTEKQAALFEEALRKDPGEEMKKLEASGISFVSVADEEYPKKLRSIPEQPLGLYFRGTLPDENVPTVAIIGARICSEYGRYMARSLGKDLAAAGIQVISGMALGVDGIAQTGAIQTGGYSAAVTGNGVDVIYPPENARLYENLVSSGGVISEYPVGTNPRPNLFPARNRIIAGLADAVVVIEARRKSGTLVTVDFAQKQGKSIFAVPGRITDRLSDGCNELIHKGIARAVLSTGGLVQQLIGPNDAEDGRNVEVTMEVTLRKAFPLKLTDDEYEALKSDGTLGKRYDELYNQIMMTPNSGDVDVDYAAYDTDNGKELVEWAG